MQNLCFEYRCLDLSKYICDCHKNLVFMSVLTALTPSCPCEKKGLGDAIYSKMHGQHMSRKDVNLGHWLWEHFPFTIVINITVHIRRSGLCKLIYQAVLYERRGTNDPWQYLISCLMTYRYSAELTVDMVSYLSTWWASWVVEDQIILSFGLEKCLIRLSLTFLFSWYIPLLSCSY